MDYAASHKRIGGALSILAELDASVREFPIDVWLDELSLRRRQRDDEVFAAESLSTRTTA